MDLIDEIEAIIAEVKEAKPLPLSASAMINKQDLLEKLERLKQGAPEELKQARWLMRDREELITRSQREAEKLVGEAKAERDRLVAKTEIVAAANTEADKIIEEAKARAREIRMEAEDYVDAKLANFEVVLQKTLSAVVKGRESLRGRLDLAAQAQAQREQAEQAQAEQAQAEQAGTQTSAIPETGNVKIKRS